MSSYRRRSWMVRKQIPTAAVFWFRGARITWRLVFGALYTIWFQLGVPNGVKFDVIRRGKKISLRNQEWDCLLTRKRYWERSSRTNRLCRKCFKHRVFELHTRVFANNAPIGFIFGVDNHQELFRRITKMDEKICIFRDEILNFRFFLKILLRNLSKTLT